MFEFSAERRAPNPTPLSSQKELPHALARLGLVLTRHTGFSMPLLLAWQKYTRLSVCGVCSCSNSINLLRFTDLMRKSCKGLRSQILHRPKVFICYGKEDQTSAEKLYFDLLKAGCQPWVDTKCLEPGQRWESAITAAIEVSHFFVCLLSKRSMSKTGFVQKEIREALRRLENHPDEDVYLIPVRVEKVNPNNRLLRELQWIDLFPKWSVGVNNLLRAILKRSGLAIRFSRSVKSRKHILRELRRCFRDVEMLPPSQRLYEHDNLKEVFNLTSLAIMEFAISIEASLGIHFVGSELKQLTTLGSAADIICETLLNQRKIRLP